MSETPPSASRHGMALDLPAVHRAVRVARNVVRHFARLQGVADREVDYMILVASELLANAIDHGGGEAALTEAELPAEVRMHLELTIEGGEWSLHVTDHGGGDAEAMNARCSTEAPPDLEDDRGRGLFLLAGMVDRLEVTSNADGDGLTFHAYRCFPS